MNDAKSIETRLKVQRTIDGFDNFTSRLGLNNDNSLSDGIYTFNLITRNRIKLEAAYRGSWVVGVVVDAIADDMTKAGIDITTTESKQDLQDLKTNITNLSIWQSLNALIKWGRLYGGAIAVVQIEGQDLSTPLDISTISEGQFKGLVVYDRWQVNPVFTDIIDEGPDIGLPRTYQITTNPTQFAPDAQPATGLQVVHHTRVIRFLGIDLPYFQAITELMWGESVLERLWDRLISFDNTTMSSASLVDRANLRTVGIEGLREIIAAGGEAQEGLTAQFEMMRLMQVNEGLTLLDKNDVFQSTAYSFAGLADMLIQFGQQISGSSGIPLVRLFGQSPAGLSATGESDLRMYYGNINAIQEAKLRRGMHLLLKILWRSTYGESAPKDLNFSFVSLWQMSATDKATIAEANTRTISSVVDSGLIDRAAGLKELRAISSETGLFSNITDEDIKNAENDEPPLPETIIESEVENLPQVKDSAFQRIKKWITRK